MTPTIYTDLYIVFQSTFTDPIFNGLIVRDDLSKQYLINSIPKFRRCLQDLNNRNDASATFNIELIEDEKQILGNLMLVEYMNPQITNIQLIQQSMNNRDFQQTSQAEHLGRLIQLRTDQRKEISKMIIDYCYNFSDLTKLK